MDFGHQLVGVGRYDREGPDPLTGGGVLPVLPYARDAEWRAVLQCDGIGLLRPPPLDRLPLVEAVHRQDATTHAIGVAEKVGRSRTVSHLALIGLRPTCWVFAQLVIGRYLQADYDLAQPVTDRLAALVRA